MTQVYKTAKRQNRNIENKFTAKRLKSLLFLFYLKTNILLLLYFTSILFNVLPGNHVHPKKIAMILNFTFCNMQKSTKVIHKQTILKETTHFLLCKIFASTGTFISALFRK